MALSMSNARLANGTQRPQVVCSQLKTGTSMHSSPLDWQNAVKTYLNANCFADPGDQNPGMLRATFPGCASTASTTWI
jgi:hypothetical protein